MDQPQLQVFSPAVGVSPAKPTDRIMASGASISQSLSQLASGVTDFSTVHANEVRQQDQQTAQQQHQIDMRDRYVATADASKFIPQIEASVKEQNLEGQAPKKVMDHIRGLDAWKSLYAGVDNPETKQRLQAETFAKLEGHYTTLHQMVQDKERLDLGLKGLATHVQAAASSSDPAQMAHVVAQTRQDMQDPEGFFKYRPEQVDQMILDHAKALYQVGHYKAAAALANAGDFSTQAAKDEAGVVAFQANSAQEKLDKKAFQDTYTQTGDVLISSPATTPEQIEAHVQQGISHGVFSNAVAADKYRQYLLKQHQDNGALLTVKSSILGGQFNNRHQFDYTMDTLAKEHGWTSKERDKLATQALDTTFAHVAQNLTIARQDYQETQDPETQQKLTAAQGAYDAIVRLAPPQLTSAMMSLAYATSGPDQQIPDNVKQLAPILQESSRAFGGGLEGYVALANAYFPEDATARKRLIQLATFAESNGGSWQLALQDAFRLTNMPAGSQDPSFLVKKDVARKQQKFAEEFGAQLLPAYTQYLQEHADAPLDLADRLARAEIGANTYTISKESGLGHLPLVGKAVSDYLGDGYKFHGVNGKRLVGLFQEMMDERRKTDSPKWTYAPGKAEYSPYAALSQYIDRLAPEVSLARAMDISPSDIVPHANDMSPYFIVFKTKMGGVLRSVSLATVVEAYQPDIPKAPIESPAGNHPIPGIRDK